MRPNRKCKNPIWRSVNFNCVFLRSQTRCRLNSNGYTHVFGVQHSNGTSSDTVQPNRKWIIQDGGLKTSNACISASRHDISEIPYLFSLGAELLAFKVSRPPSWIIHFRFGCTVSALVPLECWTPKTWV